MDVKRNETSCHLSYYTCFVVYDHAYVGWTLAVDLRVLRLILKRRSKKEEEKKHEKEIKKNKRRSIVRKEIASISQHNDSTSDDKFVIIGLAVLGLRMNQNMI